MTQFIPTEIEMGALNLMDASTYEIVGDLRKTTPFSVMKFSPSPLKVNSVQFISVDSVKRLLEEGLIELSSAQESEEVRVFVITPKGRAFCRVEA